MPVLYESEQLLVVHKPAGVPFQCVGARAGAVELARRAHVPGYRARSGGDDDGDGGGGGDGLLLPVHRLDAVTSGALVLARTREAAAAAAEEFRARRVSKYYVALSARRPRKKQGVVAGGMERARRSQWRLTRGAGPAGAGGGNFARTRFDSWSVDSARHPRLRAFCLKPETGRTHQLRVAMKSLGAPILGDPLYAHAADAAQERRCYLHAAAVRLRVRGEAVSVVAPPALSLCYDDLEGDEEGDEESPSRTSEFATAEFVEWWERTFELALADGGDREDWFDGSTQLSAPPP